MDAKERKIIQVLTENLSYVIPEYQRPYSWEVDHAQQLIDDICESWRDKEKEYFIGSLITIARIPDQVYEVVDGQQRLTTLNLIMAKLRDAIKSGRAYDDLQNRLRPVDAFTNKTDAPRLTLRAEDQRFFVRHVIEAQPISDDDIRSLKGPQRHLFLNGQKISQQLEGMTKDELLSLSSYILNNVYVVFVSTTSFESAYRLFNVLNTRGLSLSSADLIKNSLYHRSREENEDGGQIKELWKEFENIIGLDVLDFFLGQHRTAIYANKPKRTLHEEYQELIAAERPTALLSSLCDSARNYEKLTADSFQSADAQESMRSLERVDHAEWMPALLAFFNRPITGMTKDEYVDLLERITVQNWVRRLGKSARLTVYFNLIAAINNGRSNRDDLLKIFRRHANNDEFTQFLNNDFYGQPYAKAVLLRLESSRQDGLVTKAYKISGITVEHVLPQNFSDAYWTSRFTVDSHSHWKHKLGNLTLISGRMNSSAQCSAFEKKKEIFQQKVTKTSFDLTKEICRVVEWTPDQIKQRQAALVVICQSLWHIAPAMTTDASASTAR